MTFLTGDHLEMQRCKQDAHIIFDEVLQRWPDSGGSGQSIHEGLRCLGYATAPTSDNDAEAFQAGYERCKSQGMKALLAVSLVSSGMSAHYALNQKRDSIFCGVLALRSSQLLAAELAQTIQKCEISVTHFLMGIQMQSLLSRSSPDWA